MAVTTNLPIEGAVVRTSSRTIPATETRGELVFNSALIVGEDTLAEVTLGRGVEPLMIGDVIRGRVEVNVYRSEDQITLVEVFPTLTAPDKQGDPGKAPAKAAE